MRDHSKLRAFELADKLALDIYGTTRSFPKEEMYGLTSQMRRAAVSIPSNIVEGCARHGEADFLRFLDIAFGSLRELNYQHSLALRFGYIDSEKFPELEKRFLECEKVLGSLIRKIRSSS